jgi:hypothetical protein
LLLVFCVTKKPTGEGANHAPDGCASTSLAVVIADGRACDSTCNTTDRGTTLCIALCGDRARNDARKKNGD